MAKIFSNDYEQGYRDRYDIIHGLWTPSAFFQKLETFGLGQTNWPKILWGIWDISGQIISTILALWVPVAGFLSYKKLWSLRLKHINPKCSQNKILAVKNLGNSVHTFVFGDIIDHGHGKKPFFILMKESIWSRTHCTQQIYIAPLALIVPSQIRNSKTHETSMCNADLYYCYCANPSAQRRVFFFAQHAARIVLNVKLRACVLAHIAIHQKAPCTVLQHDKEGSSKVFLTSHLVLYTVDALLKEPL